MTVAHKNLTGTDLHEPKGVAAAAVDKVYVSDGAGSGTWKKLTASQLETTGNPFGAQLFHIQDQQTSGTYGGTFTAGAWRTRTLNTSVTNEITSASLTSNQITLPAGTYYIEATAPAHQCNAHKAKLYNVTDAADILFGTSAFTNSVASYAVTESRISGRFTLSGTKTLELRHQCTSSRTTDGLGYATFMGTEIYSEVKIWKVA